MPTIEKNTAPAPLIKEFVYEFKAKDRLPLELDHNSKIFLVINDVETSIPIESVFIGGVEVDDEDITGYSILQLISGGTQLKIDENTVLTITFIDKTKGREFYISKIRRPFFYEDDMEISSESRLKYIDLLLTTSLIPIKAIEAEQKQAQEMQEAREREAEAEKENQRLKEEQEKEQERLKIEHEAAMVVGGLEWPEQREELLKQGLTEYTFDEYRMFYKPAEVESAAEIGFFTLIPGNYEFVELYEEEITDEKEEYSFEDDKEDELRLVFDKVEGKIVVSK